MRCIIVDDEAIERKGLMKMIEKEMPEVTIIGEAKNGRIAIELAEELRPDVMLMDIKMPGVDGVEAVKAIRKLNRDIKFIMISAFNTFEYAKEVMQEGVKEYILKPSRKEEVMAALKRVQLDLDEQREQQALQENYKQALSLMESGWLSSLLLEQVEEFYLEEWNSLLKIDAVMGSIILFSFKEKGLDKKRLKLYYNWLKRKIKHSIDDVVVGPIIEEKIPVLLLVRHTTSTSKVKASAKQVCRMIIQQFQDEFHDVKMRAGIGVPYALMEDFGKSYHEAIVALEHSDEGNVPYAYFSEQLVTTAQTTNRYTIEAELLELIKTGERVKVMQVFEQYMDEVVTQSEGDMRLIVRALEECFVVVSRELYKIGYQVNGQYTFAIVPLEELRNAAKAKMTDLFQGFSVWRQPHMKGIIQIAKELVEERYKEALTLEEVADSVNLSPIYFSKVFKERMGVTFIDYVTDLRILYAKEEIMKTNKSLKEICFNAGYNDPNYFSRVFKKKTGVTPKEYRLKYMNN